MSVILLLLFASLSIALVFLAAFIWSVRNRQFEDEFSPPLRILFNDGPVTESLPVIPPAPEKESEQMVSSSSIQDQQSNQ